MAPVGTKDKMVASAVRLLRERGVQGLTIDAVLADSGAPRGSVYYHFPGGRQAIVQAAAQSASAYITRIFKDAADAGEPISALQQFAQMWRQTLEESDYTAGCPVAALTTGGSAELSNVANDAFRAWQALFAEAIEASGTTHERAVALAGMAISAIEGALPLCRAARSTAPLDNVIGQVVALITSASLPV